MEPLLITDILRGTNMNINVLDKRAYEAYSIYLIVLTKDVCNYVLLEEGTGDNLNDDDIKDGYVDYVNYSFGHFEENTFIDVDGGMLLRKTLIRDSNEGLVSVIQDFIKTEYLDDEIVKNVYVISA